MSKELSIELKLNTVESLVVLDALNKYIFHRENEGDVNVARRVRNNMNIAVHNYFEEKEKEEEQEQSNNDINI